MHVKESHWLRFFLRSSSTEKLTAWRLWQAEAEIAGKRRDMMVQELALQANTAGQLPILTPRMFRLIVKENRLVPVGRSAKK